MSRTVPASPASLPLSHRDTIRRAVRTLPLVIAGLALFASSAKPLDPIRQISQYGHSVWRIQDGFLPGLPEAFAQTTDGYLWIGTYTGLVRFDGIRFVPFVSEDGNKLNDNRIQALLAGRDGSLWIGTGNGLARYKNGHLTNFASPGGRINDFVEDADGNVWLARSLVPDEQGPLCRMTGVNPRCYGKADGIPFLIATRLATDQSGNIWIGSWKGLCRWKPGSVSVYFEDEFSQPNLLLGVLAVVTQKNGDVWAGVQLPDGALELRQFTHGTWKTPVLSGTRADDMGVTSLFSDNLGALWIGTARKGIFRLFEGRLDHFASADGLSSDAIAEFFQDREGTLWIASSKGVDSFRDLPVVSYSLKEGLTADSVSTVQAMQDGTVYIGNSGALDFLKDNKLSAILTNHGLPGHDVTSMFEDHDGRLWVGVDSGLYFMDRGVMKPVFRPDGKRLGVVLGMAQDSKGTLWVHAAKTLVRVANFKFVDQVDLPEIVSSTSITSDPSNGIWLGFDTGAVGHFHDGRLDTLPADPSATNVKLRDPIVGSDGSVMGVTEKGLVWFKDGKSAVLSAKNGLPCDDIYSGVKDQRGALWLYTRCGLVSLAAGELASWQADHTALLKPQVFDLHDGVQPGFAPNQHQSSRSPDGRLWFANDAILQTIDPANLHKNTLAPNVVIERIVADGVAHPADENFRLPALTRNLEIDYTALSFVVPQKVLFRYKLVGHDTDWQDPQSRRQAFYSDLRPGTYRFLVAACNNDGVWNETGSTMSFTIAPAFFQTVWFSLLSTAAFLAILWMIYWLRMRQVAAGIRARMEERLSERERIARELHDTLLQSVQGLILRFHAVTKQLPADQPARRTMEATLDRADEVLAEGRDRVFNLRSSAELSGDLANAFRQVVEQYPQERTTSLRVADQGTVRDLHPVVREEIYSIGREAIANALLHSDGTRIDVEIVYDPRALLLQVRDDGRGIAPELLKAGGRQGHWGLQGMRERAKQIGAHLEIWSRAGAGTEVSLRIPGNRAYRSKPTESRWPWLRRVLSRTGD